MFQFKQFSLKQDQTAFKVGTDSILLGAWLEAPNVRTILDIGSGTGLIALMLAQRYPQAMIHAVELDESSAVQAKDNCQNCIFSRRLAVFQADISLFKPPDRLKYDCIVCNPPYFDPEMSTPSPHAVRQPTRHTFTLSHPKLLNAAARLLAPNGRLHIILPISASASFEKMAAAVGLHATRKTVVQPKPSKPPHRVLIQYERQKGNLNRKSIIIETETRHIYSPEFIELTQKFYAADLAS